MFSKALVVLAISASAFATVFVHDIPCCLSTFTAGQAATVSWQDDGSDPSLKDFGPAKISIYVGNAIQQTPLQTISASTDVSTTGSVQFTPDASIGPNGNDYFVRFESLSLKDAKAPQFPALAFSAKFTMAGMSGTFNASVKAQIDGQSTAPIGGPTAAASGSGAPAATTTSGSKPAASSGAASKASASASASKAPSASSAASKSSIGWIGMAAGAALGAAMF
ncbi:hypothetical protein BD779DRAFT_1766360 [Infundibulicybe gibba]|nr:hypothetical protein BD779DRAFT_1766360 [Infundibulicybe gibba]